MINCSTSKKNKDTCWWLSRSSNGLVWRNGRKIDVFFNNAGIEGVVKPIIDYPDDVFDMVIAVNIKGVFNTSNDTKYEKDPPDGTVFLYSVNTFLLI